MEELPDEYWDRSTILRVVEHMFRPEEREEVLAAMAGWDEAPRIQLAILALAAGDPDRIAEGCREAGEDWRDLLFGAFSHGRYFVDPRREELWRDVFAMLGVPPRGWPVMEPHNGPLWGLPGHQEKRN